MSGRNTWIVRKWVDSMDLHFVDRHHEAFYHRVLINDDNGKLLAYILGADATTREHFWEIYDGGGIRSGCWRESWNTPESRFVIAWAMAMVEDMETPAAAGGTLVPCLLTAYRWSNVRAGWSNIIIM